MEEGWLAIFLCTLFVFSAEGVPSFTTKPQKTFHAVQGENITLEWKYTFSKGESFRQALFVMGNLQLADKHAVDSTPWISNAYRGRLYVNITNHYTSITLLRVKRADKGSYTLEVITNPDRDRYSSTVEISVLYKPEIAAHPHNITTEEGHDVTLYCNATGNPAPTISWTKYGNPISNGSRIILSPSHEQLTITNVNRIDSGKYKCQAKNRVGTDTSFAFTVTVHFAPEISIPPRNVTVVKGEHVTLTCSVAGNPTPSVVWTKNGKDLDVTANSPLKLSSRKHNHSLEIAEVDLSDSGQYICVANNSQGKLSSSAATLTVQLPSEVPSFVVTVLNSTAVNVSWQVLRKEKARGAIFGYYVLYRVKRTLPWINKTVDGAETTSLLVGPLNEHTTYEFSMQVFNGKGVSNLSVLVEKTTDQQSKPNVKGLPERTIFQVGDVMLLTCEATGDPKPSVTWSRDGNTNIPRAQFRNDGHILVIQEVAPRDGGIYECRASNIFGQRRTATAVIIAVPPSIRKDVSPPSVICAKDTPCTLLCHATSAIPFNYSWTRNDHALNGRNIKVVNNTLIVTPLDDQDFGDYVCRATNLFGSTTYKITLSESLEDEHNVQSIFQAGHIAWSCIVFVLLVLIGLLIRWLRRARAINRTATAEKAIIVDAVQSALPLEQHMSEPASYMELHPRPSDGQTRVPSEYQSLRGGHVNAGYYNVVPEEANKKGPSEEIYEEIELYDC